jgi:hypothetical protein
MQYGVPSGLGISDVEDDVEPWQIVYAIVSWQSVEEVETTEGDEHTDEEHQHMGELWFPAVLRPCHRPGGHAPALTWFGPMHVMESRKEAMGYAKTVIRRIRNERVELDRALGDLTAEAAAEALENGA